MSVVRPGQDARQLGPGHPDPRHPRRRGHRLQPARRVHPAQARRPDAGRHLRRHHHHVERLADHRPQPGGAACRPTPSPPRSGPTARAPPTSSPTTSQSASPTAWTLGTSKTIAWPSAAVQTPKNSGVASSIQSTPYSIGYVELSYAIQNKMTLRGGQERRRRLRGAEPGHGGGRRRPEDRGDAHRLLDRERARRHQLPDRRLQLGHPAAEADQRHHRVPRWSRSSTGRPTPVAARTWRPSPRTTWRCRRPCRTRTGRSCSPSPVPAARRC